MTTSTRLAILTAVAASFAAGLVAAQSLDYATYKAKVEPIFLKKREGHARCVVCHAGAANGFHLQPLAPGATTWTEEQSKQNFETVSKLVFAANLMSSPILKHPLAHGPAATISIAAAANSLRRAIPTGRPSKSGLAARRT